MFTVYKFFSFQNVFFLFLLSCFEYDQIRGPNFKKTWCKVCSKIYCFQCKASEVSFKKSVEILLKVFATFILIRERYKIYLGLQDKVRLKEFSVKQNLISFPTEPREPCLGAFCALQLFLELIPTAFLLWTVGVSAIVSMFSCGSACLNLFARVIQYLFTNGQ